MHVTCGRDQTRVCGHLSSTGLSSPNGPRYYRCCSWNTAAPYTHGNTAPAHNTQPNYNNLLSTPRYYAWELPLLALVGVLGGLLGALWTRLAIGVLRLRARYATRLGWRNAEVVLVAVVTSTVSHGVA